MDKSTYRSYLLRLWRDNTLAPWRASLQPPGQAELLAFADLESLFAFLRSLANEPQEQPSPLRGLKANEPPEDTSNRAVAKLSIVDGYHRVSRSLLFTQEVDMNILPGLPLAASDETQKFAVIFDFDTDSCYPAAAISPDGQVNQGLDATGDITGGCRDLTQFQNANTYSRALSISKNGSTYTVHMYALYFQKDQALQGVSWGGHRHDWEHALVWLKDGVLTHASYSSHGDVTTKAKEELSFDAGQPNHVKIVYHKDGVRTHCFRFAKENEPAENGLHAANEPAKWITPTVVEWDQMHGTAVSNEQLRVHFNSYNYGDANCSFNDKNFPNEIAKSPPSGYPTGDEWRNAAVQAILTPPATPSGLVARWLVLPGDRNADRDDRTVNLLKGQRARIIVYLPEPAKSQFHFTLKHDKHNADDRARTGLIGNGSEVLGDAQDWPGFGNRIYLGDRNETDKPGFAVAPYGFYVDLVLV